MGISNLWPSLKGFESALLSGRRRIVSFVSKCKFIVVDGPCVLYQVANDQNAETEKGQDDTLIRQIVTQMKAIVAREFGILCSTDTLLVPLFDGPAGLWKLQEMISRRALASGRAAEGLCSTLRFTCGTRFMHSLFVAIYEDHFPFVQLKQSDSIAESSESSGPNESEQTDTSESEQDSNESEKQDSIESEQDRNDDDVREKLIDELRHIAIDVSAENEAEVAMGALAMATLRAGKHVAGGSLLVSTDSDLVVIGLMQVAMRWMETDNGESTTLPHLIVWRYGQAQGVDVVALANMLVQGARLPADARGRLKAVAVLDWCVLAIACGGNDYLPPLRGSVTPVDLAWSSYCRESFAIVYEGDDGELCVDAARLAHVFQSLTPTAAASSTTARRRGNKKRQRNNKRRHSKRQQQRKPPPRSQADVAAAIDYTRALRLVLQMYRCGNLTNSRFAYARAQPPSLADLAYVGRSMLDCVRLPDADASLLPWQIIAATLPDNGGDELPGDVRGLLSQAIASSSPSSSSSSCRALIDEFDRLAPAVDALLVDKVDRERLLNEYAHSSTSSFID
jgi:hypothetical protein